MSIREVVGRVSGSRICPFAIGIRKTGSKCDTSAVSPRGRIQRRQRQPAPNSMATRRLPLRPRAERPIPLPMDAGSNLVVVSPHLDDAVFSCGELLAACSGATVITVFAGKPTTAVELTDWDRAAGFAAGDDVIAQRRNEDQEALRLLGAQPVWFDYLDAQYGYAAKQDEMQRQLSTSFAEHKATAVVLPLGLFHEDHRLVSDIGIGLVGRLTGIEWYLYEDALYRTLPGLVHDRLVALRARGLTATPISGALSDEDLQDRKNRAVDCYRSQLQALATPSRPGHHDTMAPERFWWLITG
jgi:LmbE family N-acetylglucosaminyl deacetylase